MAKARLGVLYLYTECENYATGRRGGGGEEEEGVLVGMYERDRR